MADIENRLDTPTMAMAVVDTSSGLVLQPNVALARLLGEPRSRLVGRALAPLLSVEAAEVPVLLRRLRTGGLSSYQGLMELTTAGGPVPAQGWIRPLSPGPPFDLALLGVAAADETAPADPHTAPAEDLLLASLDHHWRFDGLATGQLEALDWPDGQVGTARLVDLVHPGDVPAVVATLGRSAIEQGPRVVAARLATPGGRWDQAAITVSPTCTHSSPRMVVAVQFGGGTDARVARLEKSLLRIGEEVQAAGLWTDDSPAAFPVLPGLTRRQNEVVGLLFAGRPVAAVAKQLFVSSSTVRNHLSAIYRKLGIASQAELMELARRRGRATSV